MEGLGRARIAPAQLPLRILLAGPVEAKRLEGRRARTLPLDAESEEQQEQDTPRRLGNLRFTAPPGCRSTRPEERCKRRGMGG
jgi:hypothetical protein